MKGAFIILCLSIGTALAQSGPVCPCPRNLRPVCGSDGKTYSNECLLNCQAKQDPSLVKSSDGACPPPPQVASDPPTDQTSPGNDGTVSNSNTEPSGPSCACPRIIREVCGSDGNTYDNDCMLKCETQQNPRLVKRSNGPCRAQARYAPRYQPAPAFYSSDSSSSSSSESSSSSSSESSELLCPCPDVVNPVCGSDGATYDNGCMLRCQQQVDPKLRLAHRGACKKKVMRITCSCPNRMAPVCGSDGITYTNQCLLKCKQQINKNLIKKSDGACSTTAKPAVKSAPVKPAPVASSPPKQRDPCVCPMNYAPVCGSDGKTYGNDCTLKCQQSTTPGLTKSSDGACPSADSPQTPAPPQQPKVGCSANCPKEVAPVCGTNNVTYSNKCLLDCQTKKTPSVTSKHSGSCEFDKNGNEVGGSDLARSGRQWKPSDNQQ